MTVRKIYQVICDGCSVAMAEPSPASQSVTEARAWAASAGWRHTISGKDLCPNCQSAPRRPVAKLLSHVPHPHWHEHRGA